MGMRHGATGRREHHLHILLAYVGWSLSPPGTNPELTSPDGRVFPLRQERTTSGTDLDTYLDTTYEHGRMWIFDVDDPAYMQRSVIPFLLTSGSTRSRLSTRYIDVATSVNHAGVATVTAAEPLWITAAPRSPDITLTMQGLLQCTAGGPAGNAACREMASYLGNCDTVRRQLLHEAGQAQPRRRHSHRRDGVSPYDTSAGP
jgi:hypothetical protein